jgi:hypothetical protein
MPPFHPIKAIKGGFKVIQKGTGHAFSKKPQSKEVAQKQLRAIEAMKHGGFKGGK